MTLYTFRGGPKDGCEITMDERYGEWVHHPGDVFYVPAPRLGRGGLPHTETHWYRVAADYSADYQGPVTPGSPPAPTPVKDPHEPHGGGNGAPSWRDVLR